MPDTLTHDVHEREKKLLELVEELNSLSPQQPTPKLNIFEILRLKKHEIRHSNFLAFLLAPQEAHGLEDAFLKCLIKRLFDTLERPPLSSLALELASFDDALVSRELRHMDLIVESKSNGLVLIIENKIDASESDNQLLGYEEVAKALFPGQNVIFVYLTPEGFPPSSNTWLRLSYANVIDALIEAKLLMQAHVTDEVQVVIDHYIDLVRRNIVPDEKLVEQCRKIYAKHRYALDLIYRHGVVDEFVAAANQFFGEHPSVKVFNVTSGRAVFLPIDFLEVVPEMDGVNYFGQSRPLSFWFYCSPDDGKLGFALEVGPFADEKFARDELVGKLQIIFGNKKAGNSQKYTRIYSKYGKMPEEKAGDAIAAAMTRFYDEVSPRLPEVLDVLKLFFVSRAAMPPTLK